MIGTFVNTATVIVGGAIGLLMNKKMPGKYKTIYFQAIGLFTIAIGVGMVYDMKHILIVVSSLAIGALVGEWMDIEKWAEKTSNHLKRKLNIVNGRFTEGLITSFLLFCTGSMTILGTIQEGTGISSDLLLTKSIMDGFSSVMLAAAFGVGVIFSALPLLIFQGSITLTAMFVSSFFTDAIIGGITSVGGIMLIGLGINILEIKQLRIMNMLPSLLIVVILLLIFE
jgi:uncharacterized membrane protein YqgA involved in biofilm formation